MKKEEVNDKIIELLIEFISDWDLDETITSASRLNEDLCFNSVNMIHFMANIDMEFKKKFPFETMVMSAGKFKNEMTVAEISEFVYDNQ